MSRRFLPGRLSGRVAMLVVLALGCGTQDKKSGPNACAAIVKGACIEKKSLRPTARYLATRKLGMNESTLARMALGAAIDRELLAQEAEREGLKVTDAEVAESTARGDLYVTLPGAAPPQTGLDGGRTTLRDLVPAADRPNDGGSLPPATYEKALATFVDSTPAEYRAWQTRELLAAKMRARIEEKVEVPEDEAFKRFVEQRGTATIAYVFLDRRWLEGYATRIDDKEVDAWAAAHPSKLVLPIRHIVMTPKTPAERDAVKKKVEALLERVKKGEDIATLAKEYSEDTATKDNGGLLSGPDVEGSVDEFRDAVRALKPGQLSPVVVESAYGFHVIRREPTTHEANKEAFVRDRYETLAKTIAEEMLGSVTKGSKTLAEAAAAVVAKYGKYGKGPAAAASDPNRPQVVVTPPFRRNAEPLGRLSPVTEQEIAAFAFTAPEGQYAPKPFYAASTGAAVVQAKGHELPTRDDFHRDGGPFVAQLLRAKRDEAVRVHVQRLRDEAKNDIVIPGTKANGKPDSGS